MGAAAAELDGVRVDEPSGEALVNSDPVAVGDAEGDALRQIESDADGGAVLIESGDEDSAAEADALEVVDLTGEALAVTVGDGDGEGEGEPLD